MNGGEYNFIVASLYIRCKIEINEGKVTILSNFCVLFCLKGLLFPRWKRNEKWRLPHYCSSLCSKRGIFHRHFSLFSNSSKDWIFSDFPVTFPPVKWRAKRQPTLSTKYLFGWRGWASESENVKAINCFKRFKIDRSKGCRNVLLWILLCSFFEGVELPK